MAVIHMRKYLISCYHPIHLNDGRIVNCGHCLACRTNKAKVLSFKGNVEVNDKSQYPLFVLLTYDNENLPFMYTEKVSEMDNFCSHDIYDSDGVYTNNVVLQHSDDKLLNRIKSIYNGKFPILYKRDVQNFIKRVRITLQRSTQDRKEMRYFACGEYGPTNYRPHYHLILLFKSAEARDFIHRILRNGSTQCSSRFHYSKLWKFGFCNSKLFERGSASYVTSYLVSSLQNFRLHASIAPCFFIHSQSFGKADIENNKEFRSFVHDVFTKYEVNYEHTSRVFQNVEEIQVNSFDVLYYSLLSRCRQFGCLHDNLFISRLEFASRYHIQDASRFADGIIKAIDCGQCTDIVTRYLSTFGYSDNFDFETMSSKPYRDYIRGVIYRDIRASIKFHEFSCFVASCCGRHVSSYTIVRTLLDAKKRKDYYNLITDYQLFNNYSHEEIRVYYRMYYECGFCVAPHLEKRESIESTRFYTQRRLSDEAYTSPKDKSKKIKEKYLLCPLT